jgi:hypothetical protein
MCQNDDDRREGLSNYNPAYQRKNFGTSNSQHSGKMTACLGTTTDTSRGWGNKGQVETQPYTSDEIERKVALILGDYFEHEDMVETLKDCEDFRPTKETQVVEFCEFALSKVTYSIALYFSCFVRFRTLLLMCLSVCLSICDICIN